MSETAKHWIDGLSLGALVATFMDLMPAATALAVFVWTAMRIFESYQNIKINARKLRGD